MKKETVYKIFIGILLALNLLQLFGFLFTSKPKHPEHKNERFDHKAVQMMNLTEQQQEHFLNFAQKHKNEMATLHHHQIKLTAQYFKQPSDSILKLITQVETKKIKATEQHFTDIKNILNENQISGFKQFKKDALQYILSTNSGKRPPKHKGNRPPV